MSGIYDPDGASGLSPVEVEQQLQQIKENVREALRPYAPDGMPIDDFVQVVQWAQDNPDEAKRIHQEATEKLARHQATQADLRRSYDELYAAFKDEEHLMTPDERSRYAELLRQSYNKLENK